MAESSSESSESSESSGDGESSESSHGRGSSEEESGKGKGKAGTAAKAGAAGGAVGFLAGRRGRKRGGGGGGGGAQAVKGGVSVLGRIIAAVFTVLALIVILGIALKALDANRVNVIVANVIGAGQFLVGPFDGIFKFTNQKFEVAVNWGIAAALYLIVGSVIGRILSR